MILQPEPMCRVSLLAEKSILVRLVHVLQSLGCVQLIPLAGEEEPGLAQAEAHTFFPVEAYLVSLRSIKEYLQLSPPNGWDPVGEGELLVSLPDRMESLTESVRAVREESERIQAEEREVERAIRAILPYERLEIDLSLLTDYQSLRLFAVPVDTKRPEFAGSVSECLPRAARREEDRLALPADVATGMNGERSVQFLKLWVVEAEQAEAFAAALAQAGIQTASLPEAGNQGRPQERLQELLSRRQALTDDLRHIHERRAAIAAEWCLFIYAAEETLVSLLSKNLGTTHFLVSKYAMLGHFWVREEDVAMVREALHGHFPTGLVLYEEGVQPRHDTSDEDAPPVPTSMKGPGWTRPFAQLTKMFGEPCYHEVDPTTMLALSFPLFFGFMVGDVGYGAVMALAGYLLLKRLRAAPFMEAARDLSTILLVGGVVSMLLGFFVFADAFGIPFAAEQGAVFWWGQWVPGLPHAILLKTEGVSVTTMLTLSILAGWLHMGIGCLFGMLNEIHHSRRHALGHLGQLAVISGVCLLILGLDTFATTRFGQWLWRTLLFPASGPGHLTTVGILLAGGMTLVGIGEGPMGLVEFFGLFGNVVSFTRLALVGVSKAAVAVAINTVLIPELSAGGSWLRFLLIAVAITGAHLVMVLLGCLSASIQAVRLHYYETFSKFYTGGGIRFAPFRFSRVFTRS